MPLPLPLPPPLLLLLLLLLLPPSKGDKTSTGKVFAEETVAWERWRALERAASAREWDGGAVPTPPREKDEEEKAVGEVMAMRATRGFSTERLGVLTREGGRRWK